MRMEICLFLSCCSEIPLIEAISNKIIESNRVFRVSLKYRVLAKISIKNMHNIRAEPVYGCRIVIVYIKNE